MKAPRHKETLTYRVVVTDKDGKVLNDISAPSKSFVRQWNQITNVMTRRVDSTIIDTDGVAQTASILNCSVNLGVNAVIGNTDQGLRVGKGSTAVTINDYCLETPLAEGVGVDQLSHQGTDFTAPVTLAPTCSFTIRRAMINNSGANIVGVRELGAYIVFKSAGVYKWALGFRDVLGAGVDVPDGGAITIEYTLAVTV